LRDHHRRAYAKIIDEANNLDIKALGTATLAKTSTRGDSGIRVAGVNSAVQGTGSQGWFGPA
jgi:hypothetical protein